MYSRFTVTAQINTGGLIKVINWKKRLNTVSLIETMRTFLVIWEPNSVSLVFHLMIDNSHW